MNDFNVKSYLAGHKTDIKGTRRYEEHTINSSNLIARFSHRKRIEKSIEYIVPRLESGNVLDYGCGTGVVVSILNKIKPNSAYGYEPFHIERFEKNAPVYSRYDDILQFAPYKTVIISEVLEHLSMFSIDEFLSRCNELFEGGHSIYISVPVEIGPALFMKEIHRFFTNKKPNYKLLELIKAGFFGIPAGRVTNADYYDHKGFDFRQLIRLLKSKGYTITILGYSPLSIGTWYGNSQVFFKAEK
ncbi:hypothetical protein FACS189461_0950 [Spirochaetia bacterium]|nr:hypothetical protein FACS189461_0950 [Spirochaetia bacterium]